MFDAVDHIRHGPQWSTNVVNADQFESDITHHRLANVVWLVDQDLADEHPPLSICAGENWTVSHLNALMRSEYWASSAVLITWDDFGGWYDHVPPPTQYGCDAQNPYGLGFRLPLIVLRGRARASSCARRRTTGSIAAFVERVFHLGTLHDRDPAAQDGPGTNDLFECLISRRRPTPRCRSRREAACSSAEYGTRTRKNGLVLGRTGRMWAGVFPGSRESWRIGRRSTPRSARSCHRGAAQ